MGNTINELFETAANNVSRVYEAGYVAGQNQEVATVKKINVTVTGYYTDDSGNVVDSSLSENSLFVIDTLGNFSLRIDSMDMLAGYNANGLWIDGVAEIITEFGLNTSTDCPAVLSYRSGYFEFTPNAFGCKVSLGNNESQLNINFGANSYVNFPISAHAGVFGKLF